MERRTRKFPSLSARNPARGGVKMNRMGMMALITEASCTLMPRYCMRGEEECVTVSDDYLTYH